MKNNWERQVHAAWTRELAQGNYNTFGVLKFRNGRHISSNKAQALYSAYWHKVDRTIFGCAADKGYGIKRWCFSEFGSDGTNLHQHFVAVSPFAVQPFCAVLNAMWSDFNYCTADLQHNWITPIRNRARAAAYAAKGTRRFETDKIGTAVSFQPNEALDHNIFDPEAQITRIKNRLTDQRLEQAYIETQRQIEATEQRRVVRRQLFS